MNQMPETDIVIKFRQEGASFERAKAVADAMGLPISGYLLACIEEGHKILQARHLPTAEELEEPTYLRWGIPIRGN